MFYTAKNITLKGGIPALFRSPEPKDAPLLLQYLKTCAAETDFILRYPEECTETAEQEAEYLAQITRSPNDVLILCLLQGKIAGTCQLHFNHRLKIRHRASAALGIVEKYWGMGIGTAMLREMIALAARREVTQLELEFIQGNTRAQALYEKMGFSVISEHPDAIRLKDGTMLKTYQMIRPVHPEEGK